MALNRRPWLVLASLAALAPAPLLVAQSPADDDAISAALESLSDDVRVYNDHVVTLSSPFMEGRVPGSRGMEIAREYAEHYLRAAGLQPAFVGPETVDGREVILPNRSFRQPFPLGGSTRVTDSHLSVGSTVLEQARQFSVTGMGASGEVTGDLVFVGYSIDNGPEGYTSYAEDTDLTGKIAVMFRFEPMDEQGRSKWGGSPWTNAAAFANKIRAAAARHAAGVIIINTPGAADPRAASLVSASEGGGRPDAELPVLMVAQSAAEAFLSAAGSTKSVAELRAHADQGGKPLDLSARASIRAKIERVPLIAENVGGVLLGMGDLADQYIVIGAHLDHLGMGYFGSRAGPGSLHPGADDNASGSAAILMLADRLARDYSALPPGSSARSIVFVCFDGEESGLNGSRYYVDNPVAPLEQHSLMINFDMIGRISNKRLNVSGMNSAVGMAEWLQPIFEASPLSIVQGAISGGSDHLPFMQRRVPFLFGIIADFHADYHTPADVSAKINRVDAVHTIDLFHKIALTAATRPEAFVYQSPQGRGGRQIASGGGNEPDRPQLGQIRVRFGIAPGTYAEGQRGVLVGSVTEGGSAATAGIREGDVIVSWNGEDVADVQTWMGMLAQHNPGDVVKVGIMRDGTRQILPVQLQARPQGGG